MWGMWAAAAVGGAVGGAAVLAFQEGWRRGREAAARPDLDLGDGVWSLGLHALHCREDRCCFGCDCPCHRQAVRP